MKELLFRKSLAEQSEWEVASKYFNIVESRCEVSTFSTVVGRYSVLPYYNELERDLKVRKASLINSYTQHRWIANCLEWSGYEGALLDYTPRSYDRNFHLLPDGAYVAKGSTNSRKFSWKTHMFIPDKTAMGGVLRNLYNDPLVSEQGIVLRPYIPLKTFDHGSINGLPVTNEWRCFFLGEKLLTYGFYWSEHEEIHDQVKPLPEIAFTLLKSCAEIVSKYANFYVLDIAEKQDGSWMLIEVNDGQMSGLSMCDPVKLYRNLATSL